MIRQILLILTLACYAQAAQWRGFWYGDNGVEGMTISDIPWSAITHLYLCCGDATTNASDSDGAFFNHAWLVPSNYATLLAAAHSHGVQVVFDVGYQPVNGWTTATAPGNVDAFVAALVAYANASYGGQSFDGVDLDWEQTISSGYTAQYTTFINKLRAAFTAAGKPNAIITINIYPSYSLMDAAGQAQSSLTAIAAMCYDQDFGTSSPSWYNEAVFGISAYPDNNCSSVVRYLTNSTTASPRGEGIPANKVVIGMGAYGHVWSNCPGGPLTNGCSVSYTQIKYGTIKTSSPYTGGVEHFDNTYKASYITQSTSYIGYADIDYVNYVVGTWIPANGFLGSFILFGNWEYIASGANQAEQFPLTTAQAGGGGIVSSSPCDLNNDGVINNLDVTIAINAALNNTATCNNLDGTGVCTVIDVRRVINASLPNGTCLVGP
jgi:GH18 family chitinase